MTFPPLPDDPRSEDWEAREFTRLHGGYLELHNAELRSRDALPEEYEEVVTDTDLATDPSVTKK